ncbi:hypothetical protein [Actinomadura sp. WMMB 499]|uniref:hypothetical protein n=1 Tax=Actinomadura sp. WMMB 499 TaxID=1219491 RepID=UPI0012478621|nr:hypothetical protein [Actinomadura sp. WMMB 499]QFG22853.1 hypothetical protein F7P10_18760 [Actinomadura sp. WMMB 499]
MQQHFDNVNARIRSAGSVPALLSAAFTGLEVIERATTVLADTAPACTYPGYQVARAEARNAWSALATAPTLNCPDQTATEGADVQELASSIAAFVLVVAEAIVNVASKTTEPGDQTACLRAARHAGHVHTALR